jgi:hydrogenase maturation protein HypF
MAVKKIKLPFEVKKPILALGPQAKNSVCFAKGDLAVLSPVYPDLNNPKDFLSFEKTVKYFLKKRPNVIAYDLHPEYQSTKFAQKLSTCDLRLATIQHHHAHIASCMVENGLKNQKVMGVAFDGTGWGSDNTLWGAEFLLCDYKNFKRKAHLKNIPLLGGERAILEPMRLAMAWLYLAYKDKFLNLDITGRDKNKWRVLKNMYLSGFNSPLASSMGRLFDAVASLVLGKYKVNFEAGLAIALERKAQPCMPREAGYRFQIHKEEGIFIINPLEMFRQILLDLKGKEPKEKIAYRFHLTVAAMIRRMCLILRKETAINKVVLSGGVFQNNLLLRLSAGLLYKEDFNVLTHKKLSCNDSGISLGQAVIANFRS